MHFVYTIAYASQTYDVAEIIIFYSLLRTRMTERKVFTSTSRLFKCVDFIITFSQGIVKPDNLLIIGEACVKQWT